jgi:hypothetical protein
MDDKYHDEMRMCVGDVFVLGSFGDFVECFFSTPDVQVSRKLHIGISTVTRYSVTALLLYIRRDSRCNGLGYGVSRGCQCMYDERVSKFVIDGSRRD